MAEQIISPGVFTRENDQSFLPQGVGAIGAAIVGPTVKGPAFVPTVVRSFAEYERRFGGLSKETFVPQTVREYLRNAGSVTVTRVLAGGGYEYTAGSNSPIAITAAKTATSGKFATSSVEFLLPPDDGQTQNGENNILRIDNTNFVFVESIIGLVNKPQATNIGETLDDTSDSRFGQVFLDGTSTNGAATALMNAINSTTNNITAVSASLDNYNPSTDSADAGGSALKVNITGSVVGTSGNIKIASSSHSTSPIFVYPKMNQPADELSGTPAVVNGMGGVDETIGESLLLGVIAPSKSTLGTPSLQSTQFTNPAGADSQKVSLTEFTLRLQGTNVTQTDIKASLDPDNDNYLMSQLGNSPNNSKTAVDRYDGTPGYSSLNFKNLQKLFQGSTNLSANGYSSYGSDNKLVFTNLDSNIKFDGLGQEEGYSYASTPFIISQKSKGEKQLFKFHSLGHGNECNTDYKISITSLREPGDIDGEEQYSTFSVLIRRYNDTDKNPIILEQYNNCNLNPESPNYIARVIGDRYPQYNDTLGKVELLGNYPNVSQLCRVEVSNAVAEKAISPKLSPKGFEAVVNPMDSTKFGSAVAFPSASYEDAQEIGGNYNNRAFLGWKFDEKDTDNLNFLNPIDTSKQANTAGNFNVDNHSGHPNSSLWSGSLSASIDPTGVTGPTADQLKFSVCFQGGFDGIAPYQVKFIGNESSLHSTYESGENLYGFDMTNGKAGSKGYKKAINILSNQDEYDINMVSLPGVIHNIHSTVTNATIDMCEDRGDAFYVMDLSPYNNSVNQAINAVSGLDTNYAAVYYPWVKVNGPSGTPVLVPPSVIVPGAIAASDRIAAEWFAPAGLNRGVLGNVIEAKMRLNQAERDRLYNAKINPIATFPQTGVCIWGQKTLQERSTALDRINVRRLLIALKKFIASSSRYLVFEQNTNATRNRFLNIVNPYLESVQQRQGLYSFRVQMDEANNTADVVDRNQLVGAIYLQPTKTAEFIILDFNVLPTGATFEGNGGGGY